MEDQRKETAPEPEGAKLKEPTDQSQEEEEAGNPGELSDRRKEEEEEEPASPKEPMDQPKEKEEPEEVNSEELTDRRKAEAEKETETERSSDQGSMEEDSSPMVHPCSQLLQFVARACAWCPGMPDSLDDDGGATRPSAAPAASLNSSREVRVAAINKASGSTGFYMPEIFTAVLVQLRRLLPGRNNPREGGSGVHH